ncbi:MAG: bacterio-opsin activator domain-containing protein [Haloferacaceae archaeon]
MSEERGSNHAAIARATLDTLPINVAVVNVDGDILVTNAAWQQFGTESGVRTEGGTGDNYFAAIDTSSDQYAKQAAAGLRSVLDGERDLFTLEYPCHTEDRQQWFAMRVTSFDYGGERCAAIVHIDITDRKLAELTAARRAEELEQERTSLEALLDRINGIVSDVSRTLVEATSRDVVERGVCTRLAEEEPYRFVWIARPDVPRTVLTPHAWAGGDVSADDLTVPLDDGDSPGSRAFETEEVVVSTDVDATVPSAVRTACDPVDTLVAIPLTHRETVYGVLFVCASQARGYMQREQIVLEALGDATANALNAVENRRLLTTNSVVELEVRVYDETDLFCALSADVDGRVELSGTVTPADEPVHLFLLVPADSSEAVLDVATRRADVTAAHRFGEFGEDVLLELHVSASMVTDLVDYSTVVTGVTADAGEAVYSLELPRGGDPKTVFDLFEDRYGDAELAAYREHERPIQTRQEFTATLEDELTDRQATALRTAYHAGYFEWPRPVTGEDVAESMDIDRSTFHQHLRVAQRKLLQALYERDSN